MSNSIWQRIESSRERWDVLRHPFYQRWSAGELTRSELADYSGQYRHAVEAIAEMSESVADALPEREDLRRHAAEELGHVPLWDGFLGEAGGDAGAEPTPETAECVRAWTASGDALATLARLYAVESGQPQISLTKREGLLERYGFADGAGTAYFRVHEKRDVEHAAEARELIDELASEADADRVATAAESAFRANWRLLDGV
ncbi:MAG: TenA family transcriptional regulator [Solirubrobacterales bacterium]